MKLVVYPVFLKRLLFRSGFGPADHFISKGRLLPLREWAF